MIIADLHIHSKYSRACSKQINFENLEKYARIKGVTLLSTGDFQHAKWFEEINKDLEEDDKGILWTKNKFPFILQTEISLMYTQDGRGRRIHFVILAPNKDVVKQITDALGKKGRLDYDGRPIFGFSSIELVDMMRSISEDIEIIPAHCMTSWFGLFGSKTGFDSVEECFREKSKYIHAIETGMSADPIMLRKVSGFDKYNLVSSSDLHSFWPWRIGREATIFDCELSYTNILKAIRTGKCLKGTFETYPSYGKYHFDGHRNCGIAFSPEESRNHKGICPKCGKDLTIGVEYRIEQLADRKESKITKDFKDLVPLTELISFVTNTKLLSSKKIWTVYNCLIDKFGNEFKVLLETPYGELVKIDKKLAEIIIKSREGKLNIKPGYDGVYGQIVTGEVKEEKVQYKPSQKSLIDF